MLAAIAKASAAADGAAAPAGGAASSDALPDPEVLHDRKHELKLKMKQWELDYEEAHGGLVPTHDDKKEDAAYRALKQQAKQLEAAMELSKATVKAAKSKSPARQPGLLGALNLAMGKSPSRLNLAEGDEGMLGLEAATADEFEEPVRVRVDQVALLTVLRCASAAAAQFGAILLSPPIRPSAARCPTWSSPSSSHSWSGRAAASPSARWSSAASPASAISGVRRRRLASS